MFTYHYESTAIVRSPVTQAFAYIDDPTRLSSHMSESSWKMGGGRMENFNRKEILTFDKRFRKALSRPYPSPLRLIQAKSSQELEQKRTLAGVGLSELE